MYSNSRISIFLKEKSSLFYSENKKIFAKFLFLSRNRRNLNNFYTIFILMCVFINIIIKNVITQENVIAYAKI